MTATVDLQELAIVVATKQHNPSLLNADFLKCSGIIPQEWELARQPVYAQQVAQLVFANGLSLTAQADRILFVEPMPGKAAQDMLAASVAQKYVAALPNADYQAVGINLRGIALPASDPGATPAALTNRFLAAGPWQEFGKEPVKAGINFSYLLERGRLLVSVNEVLLQSPDEQTLPALLFAGNFEYDLAAVTENRLAKLTQGIAQWQADLEIFKDLVNNRFLSGERLAWSPSAPDLIGIGG